MSMKRTNNQPPVWKQQDSKHATNTIGEERYQTNIDIGESVISKATVNTDQIAETVFHCLIARASYTALQSNNEEDHFKITSRGS